MTKKQKKMVARLVGSAVFFIVAMMLEKKTFWAWIPFVLSYLAAGYDIPLRACRNLKNGQVFDENFLMTIATLGAFAIGSLEEAVAVMLFYQIGELFNDYAVNKSRKSITDLMDINPEYANLLRDGEEEQVDPYEVEIGDTIIIRPGEKVPLDGIVLEGSSTLDTKALTGESMPVRGGNRTEYRERFHQFNRCSEGADYQSCLMIPLWQRFWNWWKMPAPERRRRRLSSPALRVYIPRSWWLLAAMLAVLPPLFLGGWSTWIYRACSFLGCFLSVCTGYFRSVKLFWRTGCGIQTGHSHKGQQLSGGHGQFGYGSL